MYAAKKPLRPYWANAERVTMWIKSVNDRELWMKNESLETRVNDMVGCVDELKNVTTTTDKIFLLQDLIHHFHFAQRDVVEMLNKLQKYEAAK